MHSRKLSPCWPVAGMVLCTGLYLLTCGDMFYTTFYFHSRSESLWAALTGLLTFQLPMAWWLLYGVPPAHPRRPVGA